MKKLTLPYLFALCASAPFALALPISGDLPISETLKATDAVTVSEAGTMSAETGSNAEFYFMPVTNSSVTIANFKSDYTFDLPTYVTFDRNSGSNVMWAHMDFAQGITVRFNDLRTTGTNTKGRAGFEFKNTTATNDETKKTNIYVTTSSNNTFNAGGYQENWLQYVNFHACSGVNYGDLHLQLGSSFYVEADNVETRFLRFRQPFNNITKKQIDDGTKDASLAVSGKVFLNGHSLKCHGVQINSSNHAKTHDNNGYVNNMIVDFGENTTAQFLYFGNLTEHDPYWDGTRYVYENNWANNRFYLNNFGENDIFVLGVDPFSTTVTDGLIAGADPYDKSSAKVYISLLTALSRMLVINDDFINDEEVLSSMIIKLTAEDLAKYGFTDTSLIGKWAIIPEPSTYAIILGALALGFVAYRRRK